MRDESSEDLVVCPCCGQQDDCPHLLAVFDISFNECSGGFAYDRYQEFHEAIENSFGKLLKKNARDDIKWGDKDLTELWNYAAKGYFPKDGEVSLDPDVLTRLIINLLEASGGERYTGSVSEAGGPGFTSTICLFHAKNPQSVFESALSKLQARLRSRTCAPQSRGTPD